MGVWKESHRKHTRGAAHAGQVVRHNTCAHLELVDDHGRQRWRGVEQRAVDDQHADLLGLQACAHAQGRD